MRDSRVVSVWKSQFLSGDSMVSLELTERDKHVLCRLQQGERVKGINLERIHGARKHVLTVRTNKKRRLFLWMKDDKIVVIHIMDNHKYNRVPSGVYDFIFSSPFDSENQKELSYFNVDAPDEFTPDKNFELKNIKSSTCYNQDLIVYDEHQESVLIKPLPVLLHGDFGSGKSALARSMLIRLIDELKNTHPDKDFVYYSHLPDLVRHMFDMFLIDNPNIGLFIDLNRIKFLDTLGFVREYGPAEFRDQKPVGFFEFKAFLLEQHRNEMAALHRKQPSSLRCIDIYADAEVLYDEFQIITSMDDAAYLALGLQASNYSDTEIRQWLLKMVRRYERDMRERGEFDPSATVWKVRHQPLAFFVGDEMQGAPFSIVEMASRLVEGGRNLMLCCDSNQSERRLSGIPRIKSILSKEDVALSVCKMPGTYRSPHHMMPLINAVIYMKQYINGGLNDKYQASDVESQQPVIAKNGSIEWVEAPQLHALKNKLNEKNTMYVVITPEAYVEKAKRVFGDDVPVYTPRQARGMEFPIVVFYRLMDEPLPAKNKQTKPRLLSVVINELIADMPLVLSPVKHQPKAGKANPLYEPKLNDWVIALSRLVGQAAHCFMVEEPHGKPVARLHHFIQEAIKNGQALIQEGGEHLDAGNGMDWASFAAKNIEAGNREQALVAYKRLGKTELELDEAIRSYHQKRQERIDAALQRSQLPVSQKEEKKEKPKPKTSPKKENIDIASDFISTASKILDANAEIEKVMVKTIDELILSTDKPAALLCLIKEADHDFWTTPDIDDSPFFLRVIGNAELAKHFFSLLIKVKASATRDANSAKAMKMLLSFLAQGIDWLKPHSQSRANYTRLHFMADDHVRLMIFKNIMDHHQANRLIGFNDENKLMCLMLPYESQLMKLTLPLVAVLAIKQMDLLGRILFKTQGGPIDLVAGLFFKFDDGENPSNAIHYMINHGVDLSLRAMDVLFLKKYGMLFNRVQSFLGMEEFSASPFLGARAWSLSFVTRLKANTLMEECLKGDARAKRFFSFEDLVNVLNERLYNKERLIVSLMADETSRTNFLAFFSDYSKNNKHKADVFSRLRQLFDELSLDLNQLVKIGSSFSPLITCLASSQHGVDFLFWVEKRSTDFYLERITPSNWEDSFLIKLGGKEYFGPLIYLFSMVSLSRFRVLLGSHVFANKDPSYWLKTWPHNGSQGESILWELFQSAITRRKSNDYRLENADDILYVLLSVNDGALKKAYIHHYFGVMHPERMWDTLKNRLALFDVCFYLAATLKKHILNVISLDPAAYFGQYMIADLVHKSAFIPSDMPLLYYVVQVEAVLPVLTVFFAKLDSTERSLYASVLYGALVKKNINVETVKDCSFNVLVKLVSTEFGLSVLSQLVGLFPNLFARIRIDDFSLGEHLSVMNCSVYYQMTAHLSRDNTFIQLLSTHNPRLCEDLLDLKGSLSRVSGASLPTVIEVDETVSHDELPEATSVSPLRANSLFNANEAGPSSLPSLELKRAFDFK
jgi:hypothetical protein